MTERRDRRIEAARARARLEEPLGEPIEHLQGARRQAWHDIVAVCPVLCRPDEVQLDVTARLLAAWRANRDPLFTRPLYRWLGGLLVSMADRRRLLFPERFLQ